ncbi:hypothetical protein PIB30_079245 [Stylosanthes scabra]|uniref:Uncharacterized protein n=1 Tax=Stylosanthes scabra TaxID=79078 RepID=A0ABU6QQN1_9FABA|nr:hypothetical protein [Stylosanthes scabra]
MFDLHRRCGPRQVMELVTEMEHFHRANGAPSSSRQWVTDPIHVKLFTMPLPRCMSTEIDLDSDDSSNEEYIGETDESSDSSDEEEFVPAIQMGYNFLLPPPAPIPNLLSVSSHFHTLNLAKGRFH